MEGEGGMVNYEEIGLELRPCKDYVNERVDLVHLLAMKTFSSRVSVQRVQYYCVCPCWPNEAGLTAG